MTDPTPAPAPATSGRKYGGPNGYGHKGELGAQRSVSARNLVHFRAFLARLGVKVDAATPSSCSLRSKGCPVLDQGPVGSCTGHANAGAIYTTCNQSASTTIPIPSPDEIYKLGRCIDRGSPSAGALTDSGANPQSVQAAINQFGICAMGARAPDGRLSDCTPNTINVEPDLATLEAAQCYEMNGQYGIDPTESDFIQLVRAAIVAGYAVNFAVFVDGAFESWNPASGPVGAPNTSDPNGGGHDLYCDGYHEDAAGNTILDCVNSWGTGWGAGGYFEGGPAFYTPSAADPNIGWSCVYVMKVAPVAGDASAPIPEPVQA
jgi:hypothetical protein